MSSCSDWETYLIQKGGDWLTKTLLGSRFSTLTGKISTSKFILLILLSLSV